MRSLLFLMTSLLLISSAANVSATNRPMTTHELASFNNDKLTAHTWISYYVTKGMDDVSSSTSISFNFKTDGSLSATGFDAISFGGSWSLTDGVLDLGDGGKWTVIMLNDTELRLRSTTDTSEMYFK